MVPNDLYIQVKKKQRKTMLLARSLSMSLVSLPVGRVCVCVLFSVLTDSSSNIYSATSLMPKLHLLPSPCFEPRVDNFEWCGGDGGGGEAHITGQ